MSIWPDSGRIYLQRTVEPQEVGTEFTAVVTVTDGGTPMRSASTEVVVRVLNCTEETFRLAGSSPSDSCNESHSHVHRFSVPLYEATVQEFDGDQVVRSGIVTAGPSVVHPTFSPELPNNPFTLSDSVLINSHPEQVDREKRSLYTLPIVATGSITYATVSVTQCSLGSC